MTTAADPGSFRDPSGVVFRRDGVIHRQVNRTGQADYDALMASGLYESLCRDRLLVEHAELPPAEGLDSKQAYKVLRPERIPFVSYPYEWCFGQLRDAALATLEIQKRALEHDLSLKDASAFNIQFVGGRPVLIDTLSFEQREGDAPWVAYRQFCQHFLAPLALMSHRDVRLSSLLRQFIDGIPLDLACRLLPVRSRLRPGLLMHLFLHAAKQAQYANKAAEKAKAVRSATLPKHALLGILDSLESTVRRASWAPTGTEWADYYEDTNYSDDAAGEKKQTVRAMLEQAKPRTVWDLGANTGDYSRLARGIADYIVAFDIDPAAVEKSYRTCRANGEKDVLPLVLDLTNPSPGMGWAHAERTSWLDRGPADLVLALALVHHLSISNNVPLTDTARLLERAGTWLLIEFVPKSDSQVQRLLASREDVFPDYTQEHFERVFASHFDTVTKAAVSGSDRTLYLMKQSRG